MKRHLALLAFLALFLILIVNPSMSSIPAAIVDEPLEAPFLTAADGAESSESLPSFDETLPDVLFYPDGYFFNGTVYVANAGNYSENQGGNDWTYTQDNDGQTWAVWDITVPYEAYSILNFTIPSFGYSIEAVRITTETAVADYNSFNWLDYNISVYNHVTSTYDLQYTNIHDVGRVTRTFDLGLSYFSDTIMLKVHSTDYDDGGPMIIWDYSCVEYGNMTFADSGQYAESFIDVSDFTTSDCSISTDGDVATITENGAGSTGRAYASFSSTDYFEYYYEFRISTMTATTANLEFWDGAAYNTLETFTAAGTYKGIISDADAATMQRIGFLVGSEGGNIRPDYLRVGKSTEMGWSHSGSTTAGVSLAPYYDEDMSDVSDWTVVVGNTPTTDGDVMSWDIPADASYDKIYTEIPELDYDGFCLEYSYHVNETMMAYGYLDGFANDDGSGTRVFRHLLYFIQDDWTTIKMLIASTGAAKSLLWSVIVYGANPIRLQFDYIYIGREAQFDDTGTYTSDGDELTLTADADGSIFQIDVDTTATQAMLDADYYPMLALDFNDADSADYVMVESFDGSYYATVIANTTIGTDTLRANIKAVDDDIEAFWLSVAPSAIIRLKWIKTHSIANFTYTGSGVTTDDYLYTDSGVLHSHIDDGYIVLNHDPALTVNTATYNVWNTTTQTTAPQSAYYVSEWSDYSSETRGPLASGTLTDLKLKFDSIESIAAIKFIEDGTAPSVLRISATPPEPDDTESVTLSALATDTVEVYKVWFRPITGPTGYSQTDYESTEQTDNLWTYEFSNLDEGYWAFKAIAFDGANNSTLDADSVIDFWVREKELIISNTLYTETSTQCSFAGQTNIACDYLIYDDDVEQESGNKAAGSFFLDWNKQTSVGTHNWGIKFYTASGTDWHNGSYEVLTTTLLVTEYGIRTTESYAYLNGYVNLNANYTVYEETIQVGTGSVTAGSFEIRWTKASSNVENVTVLFESGSQSYPVYSGYDVAEQVTFVVESWWMDLNLGVESYVEFYVLTSFENATVQAYDNNTLMTTVTESAGGAYSYFWMSESEGLHIITLNITHGATVHTRTRTFYIPDWAATGLVVRWDLWTFQDNYTMLQLGSNWMNCTYYIYLNSSLVATSANDPVTLNFTRAINIGTYNLTIYADGGAQTYTIKNIRYIITEEGVSYDYSSVTGGVTYVGGDTYEGDNVVINENPPGIYMTAETAATIAVSTVFIFFLAVLFMNSRVKKAQLDQDKKENQ